jgi:hypothetical protein
MVGVVGDEGTVLGKDKKGTVGRERRRGFARAMALLRDRNPWSGPGQKLFSPSNPTMLAALPSVFSCSERSFGSRVSTSFARDCWTTWRQLRGNFYWTDL